MNHPFRFVERDDELYRLQNTFLTQVTGKRNSRPCVSYIIRGRKGIGKSRLVREYIESLEHDEKIAVNAAGFSGSRHLIHYNCQKDNQSPYLPFIEITRNIELQRKALRILKKTAMLLLSMIPFLNIRDLAGDLIALGQEFSGSDQSRQNKERKIFKSYIRMLRSLSRRHPLILYIENVQWIDQNSMNLLHTLIAGRQSGRIWGMIILEENDEEVLNTDLFRQFRQLINAGHLKEFHLHPLKKGYERQLLEDSIAPELFTSDEYDYIYTLSGGFPGLLEEAVEEWQREKLIYREGGAWKKADGFIDEIKTPVERLLDLIIEFLRDGEISSREQRLLMKTARQWRFADSEVRSMIETVNECRAAGFEIKQWIRKGMLAPHAFLAYTDDGEKVTVEYIEQQKKSRAVINPVEIQHHRIISIQDVIPVDKGVIIVTGYIEGIPIQQELERVDKDRMLNIVRKAAQIAEGLAELHRNGIVQGFLLPESIVTDQEGEIRVSSFNIQNVNILDLIDDTHGMHVLSHSSPEFVNSTAIDERSDIFAFGILLFEMLTDEVLFQSGSRSEVKKKVRYAQIPDFSALRRLLDHKLQAILKRCLHQDPDMRYGSCHDLIADLKKYSPVPDPPDNERLPVETPAQSRRRPWPIPVIVLLLFVTILAVIRPDMKEQFCRLMPGCGGEWVPETVVVHAVQTDEGLLGAGGINGQMMRYLIVDDLIQSSNLIVLDPESFRMRYGSKRKPVLSIQSSLSENAIGYQLSVRLKHQGRDNEMVVDFVSPAVLLTGKISALTTEILAIFNKKAKQSVLTPHWAAFDQFYQGEQAWARLDNKKAENCFQQAIQIDGDFHLAKIRLAAVLNFGGRVVEAKACLDEAMPYLHLLSHLDSLKARAIDARLSGDVYDEINILSEVFDLNPTRKECAYDVAEAYYALCNVKEARNYYLRALNLDPDYALAHNHLAYCYSHLARHDKALTHFRYYLSIDSTANAYDSYGDGLFSAGKLDSAVWAKETGLALSPSVDYLYSSLGYIKLFQGKTGEARKLFNRFLDLQSAEDQIAGGYVRLAFCDYFEKRYSHALNLLTRAQELFDSTDPVVRNHEMHWLLALVYFEMGETDQARAEIALMKQIMDGAGINTARYSQGIVKFYHHLNAVMAARTGNVEMFLKTVDLFDTVLRDKVKDHTSPFDLAFFFHALGVLALEELNRIDLAETCFKKSLQVNPDFVPAHFQLALLKREAGQTDGFEQHRAVVQELWQKADSTFMINYPL